MLNNMIKTTPILHTLFLPVLILLLPHVSTAQRSDSLTCGYNHRISWGQIAAPALLTTGGSIISASQWLHNQIDESIHTWSQQDGHPRFEVENYLQYAPIASVVALKAFGFESRHNWRDILNLGGGAAILCTALSNGLKYTFDVERPYPGVFNSFPSGHTMTAFFGAEMLRREYGEEYPGIAIAGYTVATGVGILRIYNNRHWPSDVLAGAGIGILCTSIMYWIAPYLRF